MPAITSTTATAKAIKRCSSSSNAPTKCRIPIVISHRPMSNAIATTPPGSDGGWRTPAIALTAPRSASSARPGIPPTIAQEADLEDPVDQEEDPGDDRERREADARLDQHDHARRDAQPARRQKMHQRRERPG